MSFFPKPKIEVSISSNQTSFGIDTGRVVSSEISGGKFREIYFNLSGNVLITYVNQMFPSPARLQKVML